MGNIQADVIAGMHVGPPVSASTHRHPDLSESRKLILRALDPGLGAGAIQKRVILCDTQAKRMWSHTITREFHRPIETGV